MYDVLVTLTQPYLLLLAGMGLALARLYRAGAEVRRRLRPLLACYLLLVLVSLPVTAYLARGSLEWAHPPLAGRPADVEAVVVLGGAVIQGGDVESGAELNLAGLVRTRRAAEYYHDREPCPVLVSAGRLPGDPERPLCAELMGDLLVRLGVDRADVLLETRSRTTHENAVESARMLRGRGIRRILLVTDATHLPRAAACFRKEGLDVVPGGAYYLATGWRPTWRLCVPSADALHDFHASFHEWLGLLYYRLRGYF